MADIKNMNIRIHKVKKENFINFNHLYTINSGTAQQKM